MSKTVKTLKIACWNSRGLSAAVPCLREILGNNDIVAVSEHWLHNNRLNLLNEIHDGFYSFGRASSASSEETYGRSRGQGGVCLFWRKNLKGVSKIETIKHDRICGLRVQRPDGSVLVVLSIYMPASGSKDNLAVSLDELEGIIESLEDNVTPIICGDFNGDMGKIGGFRGTGPTSKAGKCVFDFMTRQKLVAVNLSHNATGGVHTFRCHNGESVIDYIMIPNFLIDKVIKCHTGAYNGTNTSDHVPIEAELDVHMLPRLVHFDKGGGRLRWDKLDFNTLVEKYQRPLCNKLITIWNAMALSEGQSCDIDSFFEKLIDEIHMCAEAIPKSKFRSNLKPFWSQELNDLKKTKMLWFKKWNLEGRTRDDNDLTRINMKKSKKVFAKKLRFLSRQYEEQKIAEAAKYAEVDRDSFWRVFKRSTKPGKSSIHAIKSKEGKIVYEVDEILEVWCEHFDALSTPKDSEAFCSENYKHVTATVREFVRTDDISPFLENPVCELEVSDAIRKLNSGKAPGHDGITSEHLKMAGDMLVKVLCGLFNMCISKEYIPINFRKGIQVPLYKGKDSCSLSPDNYRGITLLSTFNKLFEVVLWGRIQKWWFNDRIVSDLQGAGRKGSSCIHTALTLQETIAKEREGSKNVFVAYYDVSKAFDSVWIDGLFYQLYKMGIKGSLWRLLYKTYQNFRCCVRIGDNMSRWYDMECGIHQGGYLSLVKYTAFIDSLISTLEMSDLCSTVYRVKASPLGYADDVAASTTSRRKMDLVMNEVHTHSCLWRYSFNAKKSAILIFGESLKERRIGTANRVFKLGPERVKERLYYDHVGVKTCVKGDTFIRTEEKAKKARTVLNMSTSLGIKKGGLNLSTCNMIFWTVVVPTLLFGCEVWVIKNKDIDIIQAFQRYAARRLQRFHTRSLNSTCYLCLGWMDLVTIIKVRKIIFLRSVFVMEDHAPLKRILIERVREFNEGQYDDNKYDSPMKQMLQYCNDFNLLENIYDMSNGNIPSKELWKRKVWERAWENEQAIWENTVLTCKYVDLLKQVMTRPSYNIWWIISDDDRRYMRRCEVMIRLLCHSSLLKDDNCKLRKASVWTRMCSLCQLGCIENANHVIMQCPFQQDLRNEMFDIIYDIYPDIGNVNLCTLMGKPIEGLRMQLMYKIWTVSCTYISKMYWSVIRESETR